MYQVFPGCSAVSVLFFSDGQYREIISGSISALYHRCENGIKDPINVINLSKTTIGKWPYIAIEVLYDSTIWPIL